MSTAGQSSASLEMTALREESFDTIARFIGAPGRASIALYRNTAEAINAVMYALLTEFRDGDNVVATPMEHNSNYVRWYAMCREILPRSGRRVDYRPARFYFCSTLGDVDRVVDAVAAVVAGQIEPAGPWYWRRPRPTRSRLARAPVPS
jgi:cysteine desulfurase/selenocysteine lyase